MRIPHGSWLSVDSEQDSEFALWAETRETRDGARPQHPFAAPAMCEPR